MAKPNPDLIFHPVRIRVLTTLSGRQLTIKDLAKEMPDVSQPSLYRHVGLLIEAKMIKVIKEERIRGSILRYLELNTAADMKLDLKTVPVEHRIEYFARYLLLMLQSYTKTLRSGKVDVSTTPMPFMGVPLNLTDAELKELFGLVVNFVQDKMEVLESDDSRRFLISFMAIPEVKE